MQSATSPGPRFSQFFDLVIYNLVRGIGEVTATRIKRELDIWMVAHCFKILASLMASMWRLRIQASFKSRRCPRLLTVLARKAEVLAQSSSASIFFRARAQSSSLNTRTFIFAFLGNKHAFFWSCQLGFIQVDAQHPRGCQTDLAKDFIELF
jgi:hypothetical protein